MRGLPIGNQGLFYIVIVVRLRLRAAANLFPLGIYFRCAANYLEKFASKLR